MCGGEELPVSRALLGGTRRAAGLAAERRRELAARLSGGGAAAEEVARQGARLTDGLVRRLVRLHRRERGPAPAPWAFLALGSAGRREQSLITDQDHALAVAAGAARDAWYASLAERVEEGLGQAGFSPCPGGMTAGRWRTGIDEWCNRIGAAIRDPQPAAVMTVAALADGRRVAGPLDLAPLEAALKEASAHPRFLRELFRAALSFRAPSALWLRLGGALELERQALTPVVLLARGYGLAAGTPATGTRDRLGAAAALGLLGGELSSGAAEAFRFLSGLRLRRALAAGGGAGKLALEELSPADRRGLLTALEAVRRLGAHAALRFGLE